MADTALKEFDQFRFVREDNGAMAVLSSENPDEQVLMVLDCERYRLARLHIFEGKPDDPQRADWFRRELAALSKMSHPCLNRIVTWGQDGDELFFADGMVKGESVGAYLKRNGALPEATSARLTLDLISVLTSQRALPRTMENFIPENLHLTTGAEHEGIRLMFSDFSNWDKPCVLQESELTARVANFLKTLLGGDIPDGELGDLLRQNLESRSATSLAEFEKNLTPLAADISADKMVRPRSHLQHWLLRGGDTLELGMEYKEAVPAMNGRFAPELAYAFDAKLQGAVAFAPTRFQIFPGHESIPRSRWFEQHQAALRRPGRGFPNQLVVQSLEPRGRTLLIGEERIEGLNLRSIVHELGPLSAEHAVEMGTKIAAALDAIEKSTSSCPIWWLPPENVYAVTGSDEADSLKEALDRFGSATWQRLPVRLRLHQTAASLLDGIQLPKKLLKLIESGGKTNDNARRATVLAPMLWFALTGEPFSWTSPATAVPGKIPAEAAAVFEKTRAQLLDNPEGIHFSFLDELTEVFSNVDPGKKGLVPSLVEGEGVSAVLPPIIGAAAPEAESDAAKPAQMQTFIEPQPSEEEAAALGAEPESLGEIVDDSLGFDDTAGAVIDDDFIESGAIDVVDEEPEIDPDNGKKASSVSWLKKRFAERRKKKQAKKDAKKQAALAAEVEVEDEEESALGEIVEIEAENSDSEPKEADAEVLSVPSLPEISSEAEAEPEADEEESEIVDEKVEDEIESEIGEASEIVDEKIEDEIESEVGEVSEIEDEKIEDEIKSEVGVVSEIADEKIEDEIDEVSEIADEKVEDEIESEIDEVSEIEDEKIEDEIESEIDEVSEIMDEKVEDEIESEIEEAAAQVDSEVPSTSHSPSSNEPETAKLAPLPFVERSELEIEEEEKSETEPTLFTNPSVETAPKIEDEVPVSGFGERLLAQAGNDPEAEAAKKEKRKKLFGWLKLGALAVLLAGAVGAGTHLYSNLTGWFQRKELIDQLPSTEYTRQLLAVNPLGEKKTTPTTDVEPDTKITDGIEKASEAIQKGDAARDAKKFADAVNLYLHALALEPASSEARTQLWKTLEIWGNSDGPVGEVNAGKLEQAARFAPKASWLLAEYYLDRDPALGLHWLKKSADANHPADMRKLGLILIQGKLAPRDAESGVSWLQKAAEKGDPDAQFFYAECLIFGEDGVEKNPIEGVAQLEPAAAQGHAGAKELLGICLIDGVGVEPDRDISRGFKLIAEAAALGNRRAYFHLGLCHAKGQGTVKDETAALTDFKKGAELGDSKAMFGYARSLEVGLGGSRSFRAASEWMRKSAKLGNVQAEAWCKANDIDWKI